MYKNSYIAIRKCNTLFQRIDEAADMTAIDRAEIMATTRFLRAYAYYKILTVFGPPIIVGDEVIPRTRSSLHTTARVRPMTRLWSIFARNLRLRPYLCPRRVRSWSSAVRRRVPPMDLSPVYASITPARCSMAEPQPSVASVRGSAARMTHTMYLRPMTSHVGLWLQLLPSA